MRVGELWRFPVKSLQGEQLDGATVTDGGIVGDRADATIFDLDVLKQVNRDREGCLAIGALVARPRSPM